MLLIGMFDSPFVRRVAISMLRLEIAFEHRPWSVGRDVECIRAYNPLARVPTLVLDDGEALMESAAILDYLDERVGPARALLPASGAARRSALRLCALAVGAAEKGAQQVYEHAFRPAELRHAPWLERLAAQCAGALAELERQCAACAGRWLVSDGLSQADISVACAVTFLDGAAAAGTLAPASTAGRHPALRAHVARCEALPQFMATLTPWVQPVSAA